VHDVAEQAARIQSMIATPSPLAQDSSASQDTDFFQASLGASNLSSAQGGQSGASSAQDVPYLTCWCHFSGVEEATSSLSKTVDGTSSARKSKSSLDMRCIYIRGSISLKIVTAGGQEFVVPMELSVERVWAIEDGIIIQGRSSEDNSDLLARRSPGDAPLPSDIHMNGHHPGLNETPSFKQTGTRFQIGSAALRPEPPAKNTFLTLSHHPLNELHPLQLVSSSPRLNSLMISTADNILFTSTSFPLVILHNKEQSQLNFALIKCLPSKQAARKGHVPADEYAQSLQPGSRHPTLPLSPKQPCLQLEVIWLITSTQMPTSLTASDDPMV